MTAVVDFDEVCATDPCRELAAEVDRYRAVIGAVDDHVGTSISLVLEE